MDKDRIEGKMRQVEGKIQDIKGDFTDNPADDIEGKLKKAGGIGDDGTATFRKAKEGMAKTLAGLKTVDEELKKKK